MEEERGLVVCIAGSRSLCDNGKNLWGTPPPDWKPIDGVPLVQRAVVASGYRIAKVIAGGAAGIDTAAIEWAQQHSIPYEVYPADWKTHGRRAGFIRNISMTFIEQALIAIWDGVSRGTAHKMTTSAAAKHPTFCLKIRRGE